MYDPLQILAKILGVVAGLTCGVGIFVVLRCARPAVTDAFTGKCFEVLALCIALTVIFAVVAVLLGQVGK